ncbi:UDP-glycosyltransferase 88A1-like [Phragmites australis]|uniref:UDP-glycosyltransferase 88A1-like n=1 Tax=Phragmites australis TaxID=29695 RepID=UPI002D78E27C|nr:UDP-glycosyltransferase 88A1-like [Phragmites australis]
MERSGHRFLWVVRAPFRADPERPLNPGANLDLDALLSDGFLERTNGRGLIVELWAPQVDVLTNRATGAFVMQCRWNSVLEGIAARVPMLCWPLYAEQKMNKLFVVGEAGIGVEVSRAALGQFLSDADNLCHGNSFKLYGLQLNETWQCQF